MNLCLLMVHSIFLLPVGERTRDVDPLSAHMVVLDCCQNFLPTRLDFWQFMARIILVVSDCA